MGGEKKKWDTNGWERGRRDRKMNGGRKKGVGLLGSILTSVIFSD